MYEIDVLKELAKHPATRDALIFMISLALGQIRKVIDGYR